MADEICRWAAQEPAAFDLRDAPIHAQRYAALLRQAHAEGAERRVTPAYCGTAFEFPEAVAQPADVVAIREERELAPHFGGWSTGEIAAGRSPVLAVLQDGTPVSICFSARSSDLAAEAGVETAERFRGRGLALRVTAAWALAIRASGRTPLYSTSWTNHASLAVARRLGLLPYASAWSLTDEP